MHRKRTFRSHPEASLSRCSTATVMDCEVCGLMLLDIPAPCHARCTRASRLHQRNARGWLGAAVTLNTATLILTSPIALTLTVSPRSPWCAVHGGTRRKTPLAVAQPGGPLAMPARNDHIVLVASSMLVTWPLGCRLLAQRSGWP